MTALYGEKAGPSTCDQLSNLLEAYRPRIMAPARQGLTETDAILITYGDQVREEGVSPLLTLSEFCQRQLKGVVSGIHILPFYPYSSDDGFSVIDYYQVNPALGTWEDVARFRIDFRLMVDAVFNHISTQSSWFQQFLNDHPRYRKYFISVPAGVDLSRVVRPRTLPLLTPFQTASGVKNVWTTFSADQVDLDFSNPAVFLEALEVLLFYAAHGADLIRLDAIAFLWKEYGTPCIHLPQTHLVIQLFRAALNEIAPHVLLVTETNVPHADNLSYFGDGHNEAQLVYNFALPPLVLHTFQTGDAASLTGWAKSLALPSRAVTFFNFLASHDGIGLNPVRGILQDAQINALVDRTLAYGGFVSYKSGPDGGKVPYELNINYLDALTDPALKEPANVQADRFVCAQAIMLALVGVPGIYFHSLFGSRGWPEGVALTRQNRVVNREKFELTRLLRELSEPGSLRQRVFAGYTRLLKARAAQPAFNPCAPMRVLDFGAGMFALERVSPDGRKVICLHEVSGQSQPVNWSQPADLSSESEEWVDLVSGKLFNQAGKIQLAAYQVVWLTPQERIQKG